MVAVAVMLFMTAATLLDACPETAIHQDAAIPSALEPSRDISVHFLQNLFSAQEAKALVRSTFGKAFDTRPDSTDGDPTFELHLLLHGSVVDERLWGRVRERIESCVLPLVRERFDCPRCVACSSLVRRYRGSERVFVGAHRDTTSRATAVVELQSAQPAHPDGSGLFLKQRDDTTEAFYPQLKAGDGFVHAFDLLHGVHVRCAEGSSAEGCARFSLIVWFHESAEQCRDASAVHGYEDLVRRSAEADVPEGHYQLAVLLLDGGRKTTAWQQHGAAARAAQAAAHLELAARANHSGAALRLGVLLRDGYDDGALAPAPAQAEAWLARSVELGHQRGGTQYAAWLRRHGQLGGAAGAEDARIDELLTASAELGDAEAQRELGARLLASGESARRGDAERWLRRAAERGDARARAALKSEL